MTATSRPFDVTFPTQGITPHNVYPVASLKSNPVYQPTVSQRVSWKFFCHSILKVKSRFVLRLLFAVQQFSFSLASFQVFTFNTVLIIIGMLSSRLHSLFLFLLLMLWSKTTPKRLSTSASTISLMTSRSSTRSSHCRLLLLCRSGNGVSRGFFIAPFFIRRQS